MVVVLYQLMAIHGRSDRVGQRMLSCREFLFYVLNHLAHPRHFPQRSCRSSHISAVHPPS